MDDQYWQREFAQQLARQGLPRCYTERLLEELSDHLADLKDEENMEEIMHEIDVTTRLGRPASIATAAGKAYGHARFVRRHPRIIFLILPVALLPVLWFGALFGIFAASDLLGLEAQRLPGGAAATAMTETMVIVLCRAAVTLPAILAALLFYWLSRRATAHWLWPISACGLLGLLAGSAWIDLSLSPSGERSLMFAFGFAGHTLVLQSLQLLGPLMLG